MTAATPEPTAEDLITVLIVDDSEDQRLLLKRHFERAGCRVVAVETAESAVPRLELKPDLAVVDLVLPGMNGWQFTELIQSRYPAIPVAITSVLDRADYPITQAALPKPVSRESVRRVLKHCVPRWNAA